MKKCGYCGRENDNDLHHCSECGAELPPPGPPPLPTIHPSPKRPLGAYRSAMRGYYQQQAQAVAASKPARACRCGGLLSPMGVHQTYLWGLVPLGHSVTYVCPRCRATAEIASPVRFVLFSVFLLIIGWAFVGCTWLGLKAGGERGMLIGTVITGPVFGFLLWAQVLFIRNWVRYPSSKTPAQTARSTPRTN